MIVMKKMLVLMMMMMSEVLMIEVILTIGGDCYDVGCHLYINSYGDDNDFDDDKGVL